MEYYSNMINFETNMTPYAEYIHQKGYTLHECYRPSKSALKREVPARFRDRFDSCEEYEEAMADFLNGM